MKRWRLIESSKVIASKWLTVERNTYMDDIGVVPEYYIVSRSDFVLVVLTAANDMFLVKQYRPATDNYYLSLPGGYIDAEETPLPGYIRSRAYVYKCEAANVHSGASDPPAADVTEHTELVKLKRARVLEMIYANEITEMQAVAAILLSEMRNTAVAATYPTES